MVGACACPGGNASDSSSDSVASATSSSASDATSSGSTSTTSELSATTAEDSEGSSTGWTFELPEGCGDGIVEPGVACYVPVPLIDQRITYAMTLDVDGDERDDIIVGVSDGIEETSLLWFSAEGDAFVERQVLPGDFLTSTSYTTFDLDGDGARDLLVTENGSSEGKLWWWSTAGGELGERQESVLGPAVPSGFIMTHALPIDVRGDGWPEFLVVPYDGVLGTSRRVELLSRESDEWTSLGEIANLSHACGQLEVSVLADFDGDGDEDMLAYDSGMGCDPYPSEYDPAWYRYLVFQNDRAEGTAALLGDFPLGAVPAYTVWARDFDDDSLVDVLVDIPTNAESAAGLLLRGLGDGAFAPGEPIELPQIELRWQVRAVGNVFGIDDRAVMVTASDGLDGAFLGLPALSPTAQPFAIAPSGPIYATGDCNGDGLLDVVTRDPNDSQKIQVLLSSH